MALICDTGGVYALYDADDAHHARARAAIEREPDPSGCRSSDRLEQRLESCRPEVGVIAEDAGQSQAPHDDEGDMIDDPRLPGLAPSIGIPGFIFLLEGRRDQSTGRHEIAPESGDVDPAGTAGGGIP